MIQPKITKSFKQLNFEACLAAMGLQTNRIKSWLKCHPSDSEPIDMGAFVEKVRRSNLLTVKYPSPTWQPGELLIVQWGLPSRKSYSFAYTESEVYVVTRQEKDGDIVPKHTMHHNFLEEIERLGKTCGEPTIYGIWFADLDNRIEADLRG